MRKAWSLTVAAGLIAAGLSAGTPGGIATAAGTLPATPAAVKLTVSPVRPMKSERFTVVGTMGTALACPVSLQYKSGRKWKALTTGTTDSLGAFSLSAATKSKKLTVRVFGGATTTCPQQVTRTSTVRTIGQTAKVSLPKKATVGTPVTAKLAFTPARTGRPAELQAKHGSNWTVVAQATQPNSGKTTISLTPDRAGTIAYRTVALPWNGASRAISKTVKVKVKAAPAPPAITTATLPSGTIGTAYTATLTATGGTKPYSWTATGLPAGISVAKTTGKVTGTPTLAGTYHPSATVTDKVGRTATRAFTVTISGGATKDTVVQVAAGGFHTCALLKTGAVKCWGYNGQGELGNGESDYGLYDETPVQVTGLTSGVTAISAGYEHTCALTTAGAVKCWGQNYYGQLGDGTSDDRTLPVQALNLTSGVTAISAGYGHTCALASGGKAVCWGDNRHGQLGDGTTTQRLTQVAVTGLSTGVKAISAADSHTCALTSGGGVECWGSDYFGELGDGRTSDTYGFYPARSTTPVQVQGLTSGVRAIGTGYTHSCAITSAGGVMCWGYNAYGELGIEYTGVTPTPAQVPGMTAAVTAFNSTYRHTCAVSDAGAVTCWGADDHGQLGDGTTADRRPPVKVKGLDQPVLAVAAGYYHTCAVTGAGVKCWGHNEYGQLGDGTTTERHSPVSVKGLG